MATATVSADTLDSSVEFDSPFRVNADGTITTPLEGVYAPEVFHVEGERHPDDVEISAGWSAWSVGYTGQHGYRGAVMHASEYLGGRMARDLLEEPGTYCLCAVEVLEDDGFADDPAGWIVVKLDEAQS